jgi:hypothetical protein
MQDASIRLFIQEIWWQSAFLSLSNLHDSRRMPVKNERADVLPERTIPSRRFYSSGDIPFVWSFRLL